MWLLYREHSAPQFAFYRVLGLHDFLPKSHRLGVSPRGSRSNKIKKERNVMAAGKEHFPVHLVGSIPLSDAAEVFRTTAEILGNKVARIPDGETGARKNWVGFQYAVMARHPQFEFAGPPADPDVMSNETAETGDGYNMPTKLRLRPRAGADKTKFDALGYSQAAVQSYAEFSALKRAGKIGKGTRMLVAFPMAPVAF